MNFLNMYMSTLAEEAYVFQWEYGAVDLGTPTGFVSVTTNGNVFCALSANGLVYYSTDGKAWSYATNLGNDKTWIKILYANNNFVALSLEGKVSYAVYKGAWTSNTTLTSYPGWTDAAVDNNGVIKVINGATTNLVATSTNFGVSWTIDAAVANMTKARSIQYIDNKWVVCNAYYNPNSPVFANTTTILVSLDGVTWTSYSTGHSLSSVAFIPSLKIYAGACENGGHSGYGTDITTRLGSSAISSSANYLYSKAIYLGGFVMMIPRSSFVSLATTHANPDNTITNLIPTKNSFYTKDGVTWNNLTFPEVNEWLDVSYRLNGTEAIYVAVGRTVTRPVRAIKK